MEVVSRSVPTLHEGLPPAPDGVAYEERLGGSPAGGCGGIRNAGRRTYPGAWSIPERPVCARELTLHLGRVRYRRPGRGWGT